MILSDVSVRRPVFAAVVAILIALVGIVAFLSLSVREYPDTDPPVVSVEQTYTGASASVIESRITQILEGSVAGIEGIRSIRSTSQDGASDISIEFNPGRSIDDAANDVRDRVGSIVDNLPEEADPPEINKVDADSRPVLWFVVSSPNMSQLEITDYVDRVLVDRFSSVDGVARVQLGGAATPSMRVWLDTARLAAFRMTPSDVESALRAQNVELPAGRLESQDRNLTLRVDRQFSDPAEFRRLVIGRGADGYLVRLGDVARVESGAANPYSTFRANGNPGVGIGIVRQSGANTLAVAEDAKAVAAEIRETLPEGMTIEVGSDESLFIDRAIESVYRTLAEAAALVVLVIFLFLGSLRATLIPAITVPICLLGAFAVLWAFGFSINLLTLLAMVLAIGLVVDDAMVVLENVYHRIEQGEEPLAAAFLGTRQVSFAVISTTLVVCAVFVPIMFIAGQTGLLFRELAAAMIGALAFSGFIALTLTPMLCSKLLKRQARGRFTGWVDARFKWLEERYAWLLDRALRRPLAVVLATLAFVAGTGLLFMTLDNELAPAEDSGVAIVRLLSPQGTGFDAADRFAREAEALVMPLVEEGTVRRFITRVPGGFGPSDDFDSSQLILFLQPWEDREQTTDDVVRAINGRLPELTSVRGNASPRTSFGGGGGGEPIQLVIAGSTYEELAAARDRIFAAAAANPGIVNLDSDYRETKPQLLIDVDTDRAGDLGVSVEAISQALQTLMGSRRVSTYVDRGEEYDVILQAEDAERLDPAALASVYVRGQSGELVPLSNLVSVSEAAVPQELGRFNRLRAITLSGGLAPGYSLGAALDFLEAAAREEPAIAAINYRGQSQSFREAGSSVIVVFGLTIVIVFLVLAAQFESFVHPATIIVTVPLAVGGGVVGMALMGQTLNLYTQIGIVMLVGLAAKNGILIVEFANQLRDEGQDIAEAIRNAARRRLRAILMTSIATVAGAVPLLLASGAGAGARSAIGTVIVFGVALATLITLLLIPIVYQRFARHTRSPGAVARDLEAQMATNGMQTAPAE